eukprot:404796_1
MSTSTLVDTSVGLQYFREGRRLMTKCQYVKATKSFARVIQLRPDAASPHYHLGCALIKQNAIKEALLHFKKASELKPEIIIYPIFWKFYTKLNACYDGSAGAAELKTHIDCLLSNLFPTQFGIESNPTHQHTLQALGIGIIMSVPRVGQTNNLNGTYKRQLLVHWQNAYESVLEKKQQEGQQSVLSWTFAQHNAIIQRKEIKVRICPNHMSDDVRLDYDASCLFHSRIKQQNAMKTNASCKGYYFPVIDHAHRKKT